MASILVKIGVEGVRKKKMHLFEQNYRPKNKYKNTKKREKETPAPYFWGALNSPFLVLTKPKKK